MSLLIKNLTSNKGKNEMQNNSSTGMMPPYGMGGGMGGRMGGGMGGGMGMMSYGMGGMGMYGNGDRQSGMGMRGRGSSGMGRTEGAGEEGGQQDGGWPGREQYGYGQMFGEQSYNNRGKLRRGMGLF